MNKQLTTLITTFIANQATGCYPSGNIQFYNNKRIKLTLKQAIKAINQGDVVEVPDAGAGSYDEIFKMLGFTKIQAICLTSSAGDWSFGVKDKTGWRLASQENRYPYRGFRYIIDPDHSFTTFKQLYE